jgi:hypothetical protein
VEGDELIPAGLVLAVLMIFVGHLRDHRGFCHPRLVVWTEVLGLTKHVRHGQKMNSGLNRTAEWELELVASPR